MHFGLRFSAWGSDWSSSDLSPADVGFVGITASRARNAEIGQADWLDPKLPTIARLLQQNGYKTAHIGKWHLGGGRDLGAAPWPTAYGFDKSFPTCERLENGRTSCRGRGGKYS